MTTEPIEKVFPAGFVVVERGGDIGKFRGRFGVNIGEGDPFATEFVRINHLLEHTILYQGQIHNPNQYVYVLRAVEEANKTGILDLKSFNGELEKIL